MISQFWKNFLSHPRDSKKKEIIKYAFCDDMIYMYNQYTIYKHSNKKKYMILAISDRPNFVKKNFLLLHVKINTNVREIHYFLIIFLILAFLLAGKLSTLTWSFNNPTIILIILFILLQNNSGFSLTTDFMRLIWYSLLLVQ